MNETGAGTGTVLLRIPDGAPKSLALLFSDIPNIAEYGLRSLETGAEVSGNTRAILPALASLETDSEAAAGPANLRLPRPWDLFELHILGFAAASLKPGRDYLLWIRFSDQRPTDVLVAATLLDAGADLSSELLPAIMGLPSELAR